MLDKLAAIETRYAELGRLLEENATDYQLVAEYAKERTEIEPVVVKSQEYRSVLKQIDEVREIAFSDDAEMAELAQADLESLLPRAEKLETELKALIVPKDPRDERNVIVEIRAGTGGDEAALFGGDLFRIYSRYAEKRRWSVDIISQSDTGIGGFKEIIFGVKGKGAYSRLKYESGVHRVQRVPTTEAQGRIHTSTATVVVLAEVDDVEINIPENDIKIDVYRSAGAGGQNVQKNSTAVRITHLPTGIVVACQDERSQLQNKLRALSILRAKLYEIEATRRQEELEATRRSQVGTGERSEKIRTYNFPQSRVTDHRIGTSSFNIAAVLDGEIDIFIDELSLRAETERLSTGDEDDDNSLGAWLARARASLSASGEVRQDASLESSILAAAVLRCSRSWVLAHPEFQLGAGQVTHLNKLLDRLASGEPLAYLSGKREFYGLEFAVTPAVLVPRPETELLVERALDWLHAHPRSRRAVDVGSGSGCIAVALAKFIPDLHVAAVDCSPSALEVVRANAAAHAVSDRLECIQGDLLSPLAGPFDLVCANLPYIPTADVDTLPVGRFEPRLALDGGGDGLDLIRRLIAQLPSRLAPGGLALFEIDYRQGDAVCAFAQAALPGAAVVKKSDLAGLDRLVEIINPLLPQPC